ncbi:hypothetical protein ACFLUM_01800 [Chloroflexota bacterium]
MLANLSWIHTPIWGLENVMQVWTMAFLFLPVLVLVLMDRRAMNGTSGGIQAVTWLTLALESPEPVTATIRHLRIRLVA